MFNTVIKGKNYNSDNKDLLNFVKTKSYSPQSDISNVLNTNLDNSEITRENCGEDNTHCENNSIEGQQNKLSSRINNNIEYLDKAHPEHAEFLQEIALILTKLCDQIKLKEDEKLFLVRSLLSFLGDFLLQLNYQDTEYKKVLFYHLRTILGEEYQNKVLLIKRASNWLGLSNLDSNEEYLKFLNKMAELGSILSEDQGIRNEQHSFVLTKEEAKKERNALIADEKYKFALTNKMHPLHKDVLNKLRYLNNIIVS